MEDHFSKFSKTLLSHIESLGPPKSPDPVIEQIRLFFLWRKTIVVHAVSKQSIVEISLFSTDLAQNKLTRLETV